MGFVFCIVSGVVELIEIGEHLIVRALAIEVGKLILHAQVILTVHHVVFLSERAPTHIAGVIYVPFKRLITRLDVFGGDDDYAISALSTIDSSSSCILEHVHRGDVARGNIGDRGNGETINDIQRFARLGERGTATYADLHFSIGATLRGGDRHTGQLTLQRLGCRYYGYVFELVSTYGSDGRHEVALLGGAITRHYYFFKYFAVFFQRYVNHIALNRYFLRLETDVREHENGGIIGNFEGVVTIKICHRTDGGAFHYYGSRDNCLASLIRNCSGNHFGLRDARKHEQGCKEQGSENRMSVFHKIC